MNKGRRRPGKMQKLFKKGGHWKTKSGRKLLWGKKTRHCVPHPEWTRSDCPLTSSQCHRGSRSKFSIPPLSRTRRYGLQNAPLAWALVCDLPDWWKFLPHLLPFYKQIRGRKESESQPQAAHQMSKKAKSPNLGKNHLSLISPIPTLIPELPMAG